MVRVLVRRSHDSPACSEVRVSLSLTPLSNVEGGLWHHKTVNDRRSAGDGLGHSLNMLNGPTL